jgi:hypothetical protein
MRKADLKRAPKPLPSASSHPPGQGQSPETANGQFKKKDVNDLHKANVDFRLGISRFRGQDAKAIRALIAAVCKDVGREGYPNGPVTENKKGDS